MPITKLVIFGQVQGVGFRYWAKGKFNELGIEGDAWNNDDGTVGAEFTAGEETSKKLIEVLRQGPPLARVKKVVIL
jgi:acylphosphatase